MAKERFFNLPVLILIASSFMLGMSEFIVVGILPDIAADLKISEVTVGNLVSLFAFVYAPVTPLGSALSARFPRFATHLTLIGIFLAGNILCAFAPNYAVLVVARIMIALVSGTLVAVAMTYAPDVTTDRFRTKFIAWVFSGFSIASVVGVPVGTWVANTFGWRWAFHMINVLTIVLIIGMVMVLPRNSHIVKIGFLPQFRLFFDRRIQLGVLDVVCGAAASYVFYTYLTPIMRDEVHVPEQYLSVGLVIFGAACLWSNLYGGKLAVKIGIDQFLNWLDGIERAMLKAEADAGFYAPGPFKELVEKPKGIISLGAKMGEGWLLTAEMIELVQGGYGNIVCAQPFGCLPNHIVGKGMVNKIRALYPSANITPIDYDPSATKVNQENRIKLMLAVAKERLNAPVEAKPLTAEEIAGGAPKVGAAV